MAGATTAAAAAAAARDGELTRVKRRGSRLSRTLLAASLCACFAPAPLSSATSRSVTTTKTPRSRRWGSGESPGGNEERREERFRSAALWLPEASEGGEMPRIDEGDGATPPAAAAGATTAPPTATVTAGRGPTTTVDFSIRERRLLRAGQAPGAGVGRDGDGSIRSGEDVLLVEPVSRRGEDNTRTEEERGTTRNPERVGKPLAGRILGTEENALADRKSGLPAPSKPGGISRAGDSDRRRVLVETGGDVEGEEYGHGESPVLTPPPHDGRNGKRKDDMPGERDLKSGRGPTASGGAEQMNRGHTQWLGSISLLLLLLSFATFFCVVEAAKCYLLWKCQRRQRLRNQREQSTVHVLDLPELQIPVASSRIDIVSSRLDGPEVPGADSKDFWVEVDVRDVSTRAGLPEERNLPSALAYAVAGASHAQPIQHPLRCPSTASELVGLSEVRTNMPERQLQPFIDTPTPAFRGAVPVSPSELP